MKRFFETVTISSSPDISGKTDQNKSPQCAQHEENGGAGAHEFSNEVSNEVASGSIYRILLDGKGVKTAAGAAQWIPTRALAEAMAQEWRAQGAKLDPKLFVFRDMTDYANDRAAQEKEALIAKLRNFAQTDTLCYRADPQDAIFPEQDRLWEPILRDFEINFSAPMHRISGIMHQPQAEPSLSSLEQALRAHDAFALTALEMMASLSSSLIIALSAFPVTTIEEAETLWDAACLEEQWQSEQWGRDAEAEAVRAAKKIAFLNAWHFGRLAAA